MHLIGFQHPGSRIAICSEFKKLTNIKSDKKVSNNHSKYAINMWIKINKNNKSINRVE